MGNAARGGGWALGAGLLALGLSGACRPALDPAAAGTPAPLCAAWAAAANARGVALRDLSALPEDAAAFPEGVASGDVDATRAVLWTRHAGTRATRLWVLERGEPPARALYRGVALDAAACPPNDAGLIKMDVGGLVPGARYDFAFVDLDDGGGSGGGSAGGDRGGSDGGSSGGAPVARSRVGHFRAALEPGARAPLSFVATADANGAMAPFALLASAAAAAPDFVVHLGDTVYADEALTRDDYRAFYAANWSDPALQALLAAAPVYATWDDHEVFNSWDPETIDPVQLDAARGAFLEHLPVRTPAGAPARLWRSFAWGDTVEVFVLDCRGERRASEGLFMSAAQMQWLKDGLSRSTATFKIVVTSVPVSALGGPLAFDRWEAYAQRLEILGYVAAQGLTGVFWLTADLHMALVAALPYGGAEIGVGPIAAGLHPDSAARYGEVPAVRYAAALRNYALITLDPLAAPPTLTLSVRATDGIEVHHDVFTP
ncbi:MAG TPA: alkaline phosphatase D family protein [Myxococcota bacterium]|jgi:alkaline phosphatase D|nr:alkaline phosphatase D family protein [Myxococcota bacterium]